MRILMFGNYDPAYSRNQVLATGLAACGAWVIACTDKSWGPLKYIKLAIRHFQLRRAYDVMLVAFPGQGMMLLARLLTRKPIIFDAFTSHYEGYVFDRKIVAPGSLAARWYKWLDRTACRLANMVLTDTEQHRQFFASEFGIALAKLHRVFVGAKIELLNPSKREPLSGPFMVYFHGHYIPLQGTRYILEAATLLRDQDIVFNLIGWGQTYKADRVYAEKLGLQKVNFIGNVPYAELRGRMLSAHVCLGIFGDTIKTQRVIPNKVFEALAVARPVITADTPAIRELLDQTSAVLIPNADPQALANAILELKQDEVLRKEISQAGHAVLLARATPAILGQQVLEIARRL